ncbi:MAG: ABC transporter permease [Spirochaetaceae bacterium]|jgi:lipoprotein-releasing system permease protein|nr:ABC transporter permease [Spirochaetaceae bacterium]
MRKKMFSGFEWIFFVVMRSLSKKKNRSDVSSVLSIFEIGAGVLALTVIIAVMNGFQLGFIENILEISSYYIRIDNFPKDKLSLLGEFKKNTEIVSAVPFIETQGIVREEFKDMQCAVVLRGVPENAVEEDRGMGGHLEFIEGGFDVKKPHSLLLGAELAANLGIETGDEIDFLSISNIFSVDEDSSLRTFTVTGVFRTGYYEYDSSWGFINIEDAAAVENDKEVCTIGIKLKNRYNDIITMPEIKSIIDNAFTENEPGKSGIVISSWRDYNKSFFNALRTEKLLMFVLVGLIFIVVALNIYQAQRRSVLERSEEIGLLRAVGAPDLSVRLTFALKGLVIGLIGASGGMFFALLISTHIQGFFSLIESIITLVIKAAYAVRGIFYGSDNFAFFSKNIFYIHEYTARLIAGEVLFIYVFAVLSAFMAAWFASARISRIKPSEILRNE